MANRSTKFLLKNSITSGATLPSVLKGEPLVNLYNGIMYFSGVTGGDFTTGNTNTSYFEVGSHLTNLKLDGRLQRYDGQEGAGLVGKILSGTSEGFVLVNATSLNGISNFTYTPSANTFTIFTTSGGQYPAVLTSVTGLTVNGDLSVTGDTNTNNIYVTTSAITNNLSITGTGYYSQTATGASSNELVNYGTLTGFSQTNDVYVTGNTVVSASTSANTQTLNLSYHGTPIGGPYTLTAKDTFTTGGTYSAGTITFTKNDTTTYQVTGIDGTDTFVTGGTINVPPTVSNITGTTKLLYNDPTETANNYTIPYTDVFVTGFTYSNNTFTIKDNSGNTFSDTFSTVTGLTVNGNLSVTGTTTTGTISATTYNTILSPGKVVYVGASNELKTENEFGYNDGSDTLTVNNISVAQDVLINGNLTVLGAAISAFTTDLYVEDKNITLNYNPTGVTSGTSVNAGFTIQDGNGLLGDVNFDIVRLQNLTGLTPTQITPTPYSTEYPSDTGYTNRGWITQLNDIVIRSTDTEDNGSAASITGVRVLAEFDVLDGGSY
jgi:hypothetical protein